MNYITSFLFIWSAECIKTQFCCTFTKCMHQFSISIHQYLVYPCVNLIYPCINKYIHARICIYMHEFVYACTNLVYPCIDLVYPCINLVYPCIDLVYPCINLAIFFGALSTVGSKVEFYSKPHPRKSFLAAAEI